VAEVFRPRSLAEAVQVAAGGGVTLAAGCTDLFPATRAQSLPGPVLDLTAVAEMQGISQGPEGWRIGAATSWAAIARAALPQAFDGLKAAARDVGSVQIQSSGTIGGNLCNASPAADGVPCLLTLGAEVELASATGSRRMPLAQFLTGVRRTLLAPGEVMVAVHVPAAAAQGTSGFLKLGARRYLVISIAMVAARLVIDRGRVVDAALAVGACGPVATRLSAQEAALVGLPPADLAGAIRADLVDPELAPIDDIRGDAAYRRDSATELLRRLVAALAAGVEARI
jgi:CO/xanthine dehydrogenase FAD-binding subunit